MKESYKAKLLDINDMPYLSLGEHSEHVAILTGASHILKSLKLRSFYVSIDVFEYK